jgi:hypothetical protein
VRRERPEREIALRTLYARRVPEHPATAMSKTITLAAALLVSLVPARENSLRFAPETGLTLVLTQNFDGNIELVDQTVVVNGETQDAQGSASFGYKSKYVLHDTYVRVADGRVAVLERRYESIGADRSVEAPGADMSRHETSKLVGRTVRFTWNADDEDYDARFTEGSQDRDLLDELRGPVDFAVLLPSSNVEEGATWNVDLSHVSMAFDPFGELHVEAEDEDDRNDTWSKLMERALDEPSGRFVMTLAREYSEGGVRFAEMTFVMEAEGSASKESVEEVEGPFGPMDMDQDLTARLKVDLEGRLIWNKDRNTFHSYRFAGTIGIRHEENRSFAIADNDVQLEITRELEGPIELEITVSVP